MSLQNVTSSSVYEKQNIILRFFLKCKRHLKLRFQVLLCTFNFFCDYDFFLFIVPKSLDNVVFPSLKRYSRGVLFRFYSYI